MNELRKPLQIGSRLDFLGISYRITDVLGEGSNAICYRAEYEDDGMKGRYHNVLIKELFPLHAHGLIWRGENGRIIVDEKAEAFFMLHKRSFMRGNEAGIALNDYRPDKSIPTTNTHEANGTLYAIIGVSGGVPLIDRRFATLKSAAGCACAILHALRPFHESGLLHLDISPDNILLMPRDKGEQTNRALLIDYNSVFSATALAHDDTIYFSIKKPFTAPEVVLGDRESIRPATDLYAVTAVFAKLLCPDFDGIIEHIRPDLPIFSGMPQTAVYKAVSIVRRGLRLSASQRYQTIDALLAELTELLNRIDCAGVTRPALWEASAAMYKSLIATNPQYAYLSDDEIPSQITPADITANTLIIGSGGMGKTTALLRIWQSGIGKYNPNGYVPLYVKLNDYDSQKNIRMRCLDRLRFTTGVLTVADALNALDGVLDEERSVMLLLDGYNEVAESQRAALHAEIAELCGHRGVVAVVSTRGSGGELAGFRKMALSPLPLDLVQNILSAHGLLFHDSPAMRELLSNPMMLSMYIKVTSHTAAHSETYTQSMLLSSYHAYAVSKASSREAADFAGAVLLPQVALQMTRRGMHTITPAELAQITERLFRQIQYKQFRKSFPEYIGQTAALLIEAETADAWFGAVVSALLRHEMALLIQTENGQYSFSHQLFRDYFAEKGKAVNARLVRANARRVVPRLACVLLLITAAITGAVWGIRGMPRPPEQMHILTQEEAEIVAQAMEALNGVALRNMDAYVWAANEAVQTLSDAAIKESAPGESSDLYAFKNTVIDAIDSHYGEQTTPHVVSSASDTAEIIDKIVSNPNIEISFVALRDLYAYPDAFRAQSQEMAHAVCDALFSQNLLAEKSDARAGKLVDLLQSWIDQHLAIVAYKVQSALYGLPPAYREQVFEQPYRSSLPQTLNRLTRWDTAYTDARVARAEAEIESIENEQSKLGVLIPSADYVYPSSEIEIRAVNSVIDQSAIAIMYIGIEANDVLQTINRLRAGDEAFESVKSRAEERLRYADTFQISPEVAESLIAQTYAPHNTIPQATLRWIYAAPSEFHRRNVTILTALLGQWEQRSFASNQGILDIYLEWIDNYIAQTMVQMRHILMPLPSTYRKRVFNETYIPQVSDKMLAMPWSDTDYESEINQLQSAERIILDKLREKGVL